MAASVGEYIAYSVGAFLACVSRVRATRDAMRYRGGCARQRGAVVVGAPLVLVCAKTIPNARSSETRD
jgi:hypothetical protein